MGVVRIARWPGATNIMGMRTHTLVSYAAAALAVAACSHAPPADYAPDPGLVGQMKAIRIVTTSTACPGQAFYASYTAVMNDGTEVPFATRYDKKHPPRLHVIFLDRSSPQADALQDGGWAAERDPLVSAQTGFHLNAALRFKPAIRGEAVVTPDYSCTNHAFGFEGEGGHDGPDVTVRLAMGRTPYIEKLLIAAIEVADAPPFYAFYNASTIPPRSFLIIEARGGRGYSGQGGRAGLKGNNGNHCGDGGNGGNGEGGGVDITIIVPQEEPFLAGVVDARTPGGKGGPGGRGGAGGGAGPGGDADKDARGNACPKGKDGSAGTAGVNGADGREGPYGSQPQVITVPNNSVLGPFAPAAILDLLARGPRR